MVFPRAGVTSCVRATQTGLVVEEPDAATGRCAADALEQRAADYVWDIAAHGRNVFFSEVNSILCKLLGGLGGDPSSLPAVLCGAPTNERIYMLPMADGCCAPGELRDITPTVDEFPDFDPELTELRALACGPLAGSIRSDVVLDIFPSAGGEARKRDVAGDDDDDSSSSDDDDDDASFKIRSAQRATW